MKEVRIGPEGSKTMVLVHKHLGQFYATSPACGYCGAPLKRGVSTVGGKGTPPSVSSPLHNATFDLLTGKVVRGPSLDGIAAYKVTVEDGNVYAEVPAELKAGT